MKPETASCPNCTPETECIGCSFWKAYDAGDYMRCDAILLKATLQEMIAHNHAELAKFIKQEHQNDE